MPTYNEITLAKELIRFPSITPVDAGVMKFLANKLTAIGFKCKILKHNYEDQFYVVKVNGNISIIRIIKPAEKTAEKIGINKNTSLNVNTLKAPMPGLILEILVTKSVTVKKGDPIIILEAMKMENILTSPIDGVIKNIEVKAQQTVEKNNVLIRFES